MKFLSHFLMYMFLFMLGIAIILGIVSLASFIFSTNWGPIAFIIFMVIFFSGVLSLEDIRKDKEGK
jgi:hypothetical protein